MTAPKVVKLYEDVQARMIQEGRLQKRPTPGQLESIRLNMQRQLRQCTGEDLATVHFEFPTD